MPLFFILHKLQFHANKVTIHSFLKIHVYLHLLILLCKKPLWYGILCWFSVTTAHQYITFMFLITTKQVQNSVKVSAFNSRYLWEKFPKIGLTSYVDNTVASLPRHGHRDVRRPPQTPCHQRVQTQWGYAGNRTRISRSKVQPATSSPTRRAPRFENYN